MVHLMDEAQPAVISFHLQVHQLFVSSVQSIKVIAQIQETLTLYAKEVFL
jgi:hemerythrin